MAEIRSPLPGTFYRAPAPDQLPFKAEGDTVAVGDVVGLVEVMKSFMEVKSEVAGTIARFVIENEQPVTAGAVLAEVND
jgi:biotin carboxyl carrier protein